MPTLTAGDATIYYEIHGSGFPVLWFPPGGLSSQIDFWRDPIDFLSPHFKVIVMDQRNSTDRSIAPIRGEDGWHTYTKDHVALLDHLGIHKCHVMGMCIGPSFALAIMKLMPERIAGCVFMQPIGLAPECPEEGIAAPHNRQVFYDYNYETWVPKRAAEVDPAVLKDFFANLYEHDFVFSVSESDVAKMPHPMLIFTGDDVHHPSFIARRLAEVAPNTELVENWKNPEKTALLEDAIQRMICFLKDQTPRSTRPGVPVVLAAGGAAALLAGLVVFQRRRGKL